MAYLMNTEGKYIANKRVKHPYSWAKTTIYQILSNPVYLGKLVSQRYTTRFFKDKHIVERQPEEWGIVENTHEPLVDQATFDTVQERIKIKQPATWTNTDNMFRGLMICGGCNTQMVFTTRKNRKSKGHFSSNTHRRYGGKTRQFYFSLSRRRSNNGILGQGAHKARTRRILLPLGRMESNI